MNFLVQFDRKLLEEQDRTGPKYPPQVSRNSVISHLLNLCSDWLCLKKKWVEEKSQVGKWKQTARIDPPRSDKISASLGGCVFCRYG